MTIPVFIISLDDATERRAPLLAMLTEFDVSYEIVSAVDGRNGLPKIHEKDIDRARAITENGRNLTSAEFACALSHQKIYSKMLKNNIKDAIVLEDDAIISRELARFTKNRPPKWADILMFNHKLSQVWLFPRRNVIGEVKAFRHLLKSPTLTSGYYLNLHAAKYILENSRPLSRPADWPCDIYNLRSFSALPKMVTCDQQHTGARASYLRKERELLMQTENWKAWRKQKKMEMPEKTPYIKRIFCKYFSFRIS